MPIFPSTEKYLALIHSGLGQVHLAALLFEIYFDRNYHIKNCRKISNLTISYEASIPRFGLGELEKSGIISQTLT